MVVGEIKPAVKSLSAFRINRQLDEDHRAPVLTTPHEDLTFTVSH